MRLLALETSFDETGAAIVIKTPEGVDVEANILASSIALHAETGGVIPETAAREQIKYILPTIKKAFHEASIPFSEKEPPDIDAIAITIGPGLIGSLLIGVETAKTLSYVWKKPLIPVNHLIGHLYANFVITGKPTIPQLPAIGLIISGAHTDLLFMKAHDDIQWLGGTRDDAAGEAFDKIGRILRLASYPAGPEIERAALHGNPKRFVFPRPMIGTHDYDFSFSGLKTAVFREIQKIEDLDTQTIADIAYAVQHAIISVIVAKTIKAVQQYNVKSVILGGGVAANQKLRSTLGDKLKTIGSDMSLFVPDKSLCTDNAAMIGAAACYQPIFSSHSIQANPELYFV